MGTGVELLLLGHIESWMQIVPLVLFAAALPAQLWVSTRQTSPAILTYQIMMTLFLAAGVVGMALHYRGAQAFQLEVDPSLKGTALFWKTDRAKAPPALAPASMIGLGLIGFAYTKLSVTGGSE